MCEKHFGNRSLTRTQISPHTYATAWRGVWHSRNEALAQGQCPQALPRHKDTSWEPFLVPTSIRPLLLISISWVGMEGSGS